MKRKTKKLAGFYGQPKDKQEQTAKARELASHIIKISQTFTKGIKAGKGEK